VEAVEREEDAGFLQGVVVFHHGGNGFGVGHSAGFGGVVAFGDH
jgi:hypothetical protein